MTHNAKSSKEKCRWHPDLTPIGSVLLWLSVTYLLSISQNASCAADIYVEAGKSISVVNVSGRITEGESGRFEKATALLTGSVVVNLSSPGGNLLQSLVIGQMIHDRGYLTSVDNYQSCASSCGLIWIGGVRRFLGDLGRVGFHAAYIGSGGDAKEVGVGNALIGAYLTKLGLSLQTVVFMTAASPTDMQWLSANDALRLGIEYTDLHTEIPKVAQFPTGLASLPQHSINPPAPPAPFAPLSPPANLWRSDPKYTSDERRAIGLLYAYETAWSSKGPNVDDLARFYATNLSFYGAAVTRDSVMVEKRKFSARWTDRKYQVRDSSIGVQCDDQGICTVRGIIDWDVNSVERNARSVGAASVEIKVALIESAGAIVSEGGSVISAHNDILSASASAASTLSAFNDGRQGRATYEAWYSGLSEGTFRAGVDFWASNRSAKVPPSCSENADSAWGQGCSTARKMLAPSDQRRKVERDFKAGWNSL